MTFKPHLHLTRRWTDSARCRSYRKMTNKHRVERSPFWQDPRHLQWPLFLIHNQASPRRKTQGQNVPEVSQFQICDISCWNTNRPVSSHILLIEYCHKPGLKKDNENAISSWNFENLLFGWFVYCPYQRLIIDRATSPHIGDAGWMDWYTFPNFFWGGDSRLRFTVIWAARIE